MKCPACLSKEVVFAFNKNYTKDNREEKFSHHRCKHCGLLFCSKIPASLDKYYEHDEYCGAERVSFISKMENKYFLLKYKRYLGKKMNILDFGCGQGELIEVLNENGHKAQGIDFSEKNVIRAKKRGIKVRTALDKTDVGKYDMVIMKYSLEHIKYPIKLINELRASLKKDGKIIIDVPNIDSKDFKLQGKDWVLITPPLHLLFFNKKSMKMFLENNGFEVLSLKDSKIPSYIFPFNLPFPLNVPIKLIYLILPKFLRNGEGSSLDVIARKI